MIMLLRDSLLKLKTDLETIIKTHENEIQHMAIERPVFDYQFSDNLGDLVIAIEESIEVFDEIKDKENQPVGDCLADIKFMEYREQDAGY